jgi:hypothetical protein
MPRSTSRRRSALAERPDRIPDRIYDELANAKRRGHKSKIRGIGKRIQPDQIADNRRPLIWNPF